MFEVRWEFEVRPEHAAEFAETYGAGGAWVRLFQQGAGYLGTELHQTALSRWVTIDRWTSRAHYTAFRAAHADAYAELDARCAQLTAAERKLAERGD